MLKKYISRLLATVMLVTSVITYQGDAPEAAGVWNEQSVYETSDGTVLYDEASEKTVSEDPGCVGIEVIDISDGGISDVDDDFIGETAYSVQDYDLYATGTDASEDGAYEALEEAELYAGNSADYVRTKDFSIYGNTYMRYYLTEAEKRFYDEMDAACREYLTTTRDATAKKYKANGVSKVGYLFYDEPFDVSAIGTDRATEIATVFIYQNPQYYFISYKTLKDKNQQLFYLLCFDEFIDGEKRAAITEQMFTRLDAWIADIKEETNDYDREKRADDIICANSIYLDDSRTPYDEFEEEGWLGYGQSIYSLILLGKSVCAGYTKTFEMLMNACGIRTLGITSDDHAWNKIRLNGVWYNVDVTWNDGDGRRINSSRAYLNKTDEQFLSTNHYQSEVYDKLVPACNTVFDEDDYNNSLYVAVSGITIKPKDNIVLRTYDKEQSSVDISAEISPANASNKDYRICVEDKNIARYSEGKLYGVSAGVTYVSVKSIGENKNGPVSDTRMVTVYAKAETPSAPSIEDASATSVTLVKMEGCEYSKDMKNWQSSNVFTGLDCNTYYTFYARRAASGYYIESDASAGTVVSTEPVTTATASSSGIYVISTSPSVIAGCVTSKSDSNASLEYRWLAYSESEEIWFEVSPWKKDNEYLSWTPEKYGNYILLCYVRVVGNENASLISVSAGVSVHPYIKGKCQMPYWGIGGGYLIGVESYDNPNQSYSYEMLILDCTLLAQNLPAWTYTTGKQRVSEGNAMWTIWQPEYGYYWTLFRVYDEKGNLIDEECYGFRNIY